MLGYLHFTLPYTDTQEVIVAFNQDTKTLWFDLVSVFEDPTLITFKNGEFARMVSEDSEDMIPRVFLDKVAILESALSVEDQALYDWLEDTCEYYEYPDMDWSTFKQSFEA